MIKQRKMLYIELIFSFLLAILFLLVCSKNSPIYPMNDWVDTCCIFTVGKSLNNGAILYKDVFDHKGPVLYFLFSIASLVSKKSFIGVWVLEVLSISGFLFFSTQSLKVLVKSKRIIYFLLPLLALSVLTSSAFSHGGSAEELMLLPLSYSMYYFLRIIKDVPVKPYEHILTGLSFAVVFWTKYTMIGLYIGAYIFLLGVCIFRKDKYLFQKLLLNVVGFLMITIAVLAYFLYHSALKDLWDVYFYDNIFLYGTKVSFLRKLRSLCGAVLDATKVNFLFAVLAYLGVFWMVLKKKKEALLCIIMFGFSVFFAFIGKYYVYYSLILCVYSILGFYPVSEILAKILKNNIGCGVKRIGITASVVVCLVASFFLSKNTYLLKYSKEDMPQYQFAEIINQKENPTLLNYRFLDGGFYFAADIVPENKYFYFSNLRAPGMQEEQDDMVKNGSVDFLVMRDNVLDYFVPEHDYKLVAGSKMYLEGKVRRYYLYQKN